MNRWFMLHRDHCYHPWQRSLLTRYLICPRCGAVQDTWKCGHDWHNICGIYRTWAPGWYNRQACYWCGERREIKIEDWRRELKKSVSA